jgi:hypothetical protein
MKFLTWLLILAAFVAMIWYAPKYLVYADQPVKSDVIILFLGSDFETRKNEVLKLIEEGYARHVIIPARGQAFDAEVFSRVGPSTVRRMGTQVYHPSPTPSNYPQYFEYTHIEILEAKKMIDKAGFRSAIFVSSPFHMRRIKMIASSVLGSTHLKMTFVPMVQDNRANRFWFLCFPDLQSIGEEYAKIAWFVIYRYSVSSKKIGSLAVAYPPSEPRLARCN